MSTLSDRLSICTSAQVTADYETAHASWATSAMTLLGAMMANGALLDAIIDLLAEMVAVLDALPPPSP